MKSIYDFDPTFPNHEFKVGFIGAHCVGKTTTAQEAGQALRLPVITEGVRHVCAAMGYPNINAVPDKILFQWKVLQWQVRHERSYDRFLTDRTTLDNAAYWQRYSAPHVDKDEDRAYMVAAEQNAASYTHLIYFPIMWEEITADGFRDTDGGERKVIDGIVTDLIDSWEMGSKTYTVTTLAQRDRLVEVFTHLNLWQAMRELNLLTPPA